jgi:hypothetical protein
MSWYFNGSGALVSEDSKIFNFEFNTIDYETTAEYTYNFSNPGGSASWSVSI